jgi:hypothetical protein
MVCGIFTFKKDMRIKINDKIYRLKEIESGVDSLMELVEEPKYKDGDFLHSDWGDENITIIYRKINGNDIYYHVSKSNCLGLKFDKNGFWPDYVDFRLATEAEKQELLDALAKEGKRWNAEKKCIEDIPKRRFKKGDKVRIKHGVSSKTHYNIYPWFMNEMDDLIGKTMTVDRYTDGGKYVACEETESIFREDWLEPYVEDIPKRKFKKGDKVVLKSGYKKSDGLIYLDVFDRFIGKPLTIIEYTDAGNVLFYDCPYIFDEDWLEPYVEELKEGDLAIFWDDDKKFAFIRRYDGLNDSYGYYEHEDSVGSYWTNAIKFESKEQYEKLLKGEI